MADWLALGGSIKRRGCWTPGFELSVFVILRPHYPHYWSGAVRCKTIHSPPYLYYWAAPLDTVFGTQRRCFNTCISNKRLHTRAALSLILFLISRVYMRETATYTIYFLQLIKLHSVFPVWQCQNWERADSMGTTGRVETKQCVFELSGPALLGVILLP